MSQITVDFDPSIVEHYSTLREYIAHRVHVLPRPLKSTAADMDMSPSTLSRKLNPGDGDTQRFNVDDLEHYIRITGDTSPIDYLVAKYLSSDTDRTARAIAKFEALITDAAATLRSLKSSAQ